MALNLLHIPPRHPEVWRGAEWSAEQAGVQRGWRIFCRFFRFIFPFKWKVALGMLLIIVGVPLGEIGVFLSRYLIDEVILNANISTERRMELFFIVVGIQALLWAISRTSMAIRQIMGWYIDMKVTIHLRTIFYDHLHRLSLGFLRSRPIGEHMYRSTSDIGGGLVTMITSDVPSFITTAYQIIWAGILLSVVDPWLTVFIFLYTFPSTALSHYFYTRLQRMLWDMRMQSQYLNSILRDGIAGAKSVKGYGRILWSTRRYVGRLIENQRYNLRYRFLSILTNQGVLWALSFILEYSLWFYVAYQTMTGALSIGEFTVVYFLARHFERPMGQMVRLLQNVRLRLVPAERVLQTLDIEPDIQDAPDAVPMPPLKGRVEFQNVTFAYSPGTPVLRNINLIIEPGQRVAFVGPSGAGKSTLLLLLLRLYEPTSGQVQVDGLDLRDVRLLSFRNQIGVVLQDTFLFGGTVGENIRYGKLKASDEEVEHAAQMADLGEFIAFHPDGYNRNIGEGSRLSGGQKQRIGIARALIRNPAILILDEATSSLDNQAEENVLGTIQKAATGRTTIMISHRLVTVKNADVIYVLEEGRIVERGTHGALLSMGGRYRQMWDEQMLLVNRSGNELAAD